MISARLSTRVPALDRGLELCKRPRFFCHSAKAATTATTTTTRATSKQTIVFEVPDPKLSAKIKEMLLLDHMSKVMESIRSRDELELESVHEHSSTSLPSPAPEPDQVEEDDPLQVKKAKAIAKAKARAKAKKAGTVDDKMPSELVPWYHGQSRARIQCIRSHCPHSPPSAVVKSWRYALQRDRMASSWHKVHFTPTTIFQFPTAQRYYSPDDGTIATKLVLYEAEDYAGRRRLYFDCDQANKARVAMIAAGVPKAAVLQSWNKDWQVKSHTVDNLRRLEFDDWTQLKARIQSKEAPLHDDVTEPGPHSARDVLKNSRLSASQHYQSSRAARNMGLPTPSPSIESTPEPSQIPPLKHLIEEVIETSPETQQVPAPKRTRPTLSPAAEAKQLLKEQAQTRELVLARKCMEEARDHGRATFLSLDVETWERMHGCLLEVGWSLSSFERDDETGQVGEPRREDHHVIIEEHLRRVNGRWSPNARDHFDFGKSVKMSLSALYNLLHALFTTLSTGQRLFLVFHDPRADLRSLHDLGFDIDMFKKRLGAEAGETVDDEGIYVVDTQSIYSAWAGVKEQTKLTTACEAVDVSLGIFRRLFN